MCVGVRLCVEHDSDVMVCVCVCLCVCVQNVMFLGDFNADCSYLPKKNRPSVRLLTDARFTWLIGDEQDTTVRESTHCAYDRSALGSVHALQFIL